MQKRRGRRSKVVYRQLYIPIFKVTLILAYHPFFPICEILQELPYFDYVEDKDCNQSSDKDIDLSSGYPQDLVYANTIWVESIRLIYMIFVDPVCYRVISHECCHAVESIFDMIDTKFNENTSEVFSYLNEYIFQECLNFLNNDAKVTLYHDKCN